MSWWVEKFKLSSRDGSVSASRIEGTTASIERRPSQVTNYEHHHQLHPSTSYPEQRMKRELKESFPLSYKQICSMRCEKPQNHRVAKHWSWKSCRRGNSSWMWWNDLLEVTEKPLPPFTTCDLNGNSLFLTLKKKKRVSTLCISKSHAICSQIIAQQRKCGFTELASYFIYCFSCNWVRLGANSGQTLQRQRGAPSF